VRDFGPLQPAGYKLTELSARLQQQLDSSRANDERISQSLRQRQWIEAQIVTLMFPSQPSSSSASPGGNASSSFTSRQALMSPGMGSTSPMYAASGNRGAVDTPAANQGPLGRTFTCVFYNLHVHFHFQSSVTNDFLILLL